MPSSSPTPVSSSAPQVVPTVVGIGNVVIDRSFTLKRDAILALGYPEKTMSLIDDATADKISKQFAWQESTAGGSVGNSLATISALTHLFFGMGQAATVQFHGVASEDEGANIFEKSFASNGGRAVLHKINESHTGQCFCLIDEQGGDRTMLANLGSNLRFHLSLLDEANIAKSQLVFLEGYIFDSPDSKSAFNAIVKNKKAAQQRIALTLSDHFCVLRHGADFLTLIKQGVDIVFANEAEILSLTKTDDIDKAITAAKDLAPLVLITRAEKGVVILQKGKSPLTIAGEKNIKVLDATGAGDQLAGGFLFGLMSEWPLDVAAQLGCHLAASIIQQWGARLDITPPLIRDFIKYKK